MKLKFSFNVTKFQLFFIIFILDKREISSCLVAILMNLLYQKHLLVIHIRGNSWILILLVLVAVSLPHQKRKTFCGLQKFSV